jgi:hypothetical protein
MKNLLLYSSLIIINLINSISNFGQTSAFDFNTAGTLTSAFNGSGTNVANVTQSTTGGLSNSGCVSVPSSSTNAVFASKNSYSLGPVGSSYTFETFIKSEGNSGYSGVGFTDLSLVSSFHSSPVYRPFNALGVSVHGGGYVFHNGNTNYSGSWGTSASSPINSIKTSSCSDLINNNTACGSPDKWFKIVFKIIRTGATAFDMRVEVWPVDEDGTVRFPAEATAIVEVNNITNTTLSAASQLHSYFNFSGYRVTKLDNFSYDLEGSTEIEAGAPVVLTESVTLTGNVITADGNVTNDNGEVVTERGFVYSTTPNPLITDGKIVAGSGVGSYTSSTPSLSSGTYYVRAFATNTIGTSYGTEFSQTITGPVSEIPLGSGTACDPYQITTLNNLYWLTQTPSEWVSGKYFVQMNDIDASSTSSWHSGDGWQPIGTSATRFRGNYNGQGHEITNLYINRSGDQIGFFGWIQGSSTSNHCKIENLTLRDPEINANITAAYGVGVVCGFAGNIDIVNVHVINSTMNTSNSQCYIGNMVGRGSRVVARSCSVSGTMTHTHSSAVHAGMGGFIGYIEGNGTYIEHCSSNVDLLKTNGGNRIGGFVGDVGSGTLAADISFINCFSTGSVNSSTGGGFVGSARRNLYENCYTTADVHASTTSGNGTFAAFSQGGTMFRNCYGAGNLTGSSSWRGGFSGYTEGATLENCFWNTTTSGWAGVAYGWAGGGTSGTVTGITSAQMQDETTFTAVGWNFNQDWKTDPLQNNGFPILQNPSEIMVSTIHQFVWVGTTSTDWNTASNWKCAEVPGDNEDIRIDDLALNDLELDQNRIVNNLSFGDNGIKVILGPHNLDITGALYGHSSSSYFVTAGSGKLGHTIDDTRSFVFPVGSVAYNPVTLTNNSGSSDYFSARVFEEVYFNGYNGTTVPSPRIRKTWDIDKQNSNGGNGIDFVLQWNDGEESTTMNDFYLNHHNGATWEIATGTSVNPEDNNNHIAFDGNHQLYFSGYNGSFSPFSIGNDPSSALPVTLTSFSATCESDGVNLKWSTATELNNDRFEVYRSIDGYNWTQIGTIAGAGTTNATQHYQFIDESGQRQLSYYHLKQIDTDGKAEVFSPISSNCHLSTHEFEVYPNPASTITHVAIQSPSEQQAAILISDATGKLVWKQDVQLVVGATIIPVSIQSFESGVYLVRLNTAADQQLRKLIIY